MVIGVALAVAGQVLFPKPFEGREVDGWYISAVDHSCISSNKFFEKANGLTTSIFVQYDAGRESLILGFTNQKFKSIEDGKTYDIKVKFIKPTTLDDGWGSTKFFGAKGTEATGGILSSKFNAASMFSDLRQSSGVGFYLDDKIVAAFSLAGSSSMIPDLKKCADAVEAANPTDPFAK